MKHILVIFLILFSSARGTENPKCINIGTRSEGWSYNSKFIKYDQCAGKEVECINIDTEMEGFATYYKSEISFLAFDNCSDPASLKPQCVTLDNYLQAWVLKDKIIKYDECSDFEIECVAQGTRFESWQIFKKEDLEFLLKTKCF